MQASFCIYSPEQLTEFLAQKADDRSDTNRHEWWCLNHFWRHIQSTQIEFVFPVEIQRPDPPDFLLNMNNRCVAAEVTRASYGRLEQVSRLFESAPEGSFLELNPSLYSDITIGKKDGKEAARKYIRYRDEPLIGEGWAGKEPERSLVRALAAAPRRKKKKRLMISGAKEVWLLIDATEHIPGVDVPHICQMIEKELSVDLESFHVVFVLFGMDDARCWLQRLPVGS